MLIYSPKKKKTKRNTSFDPIQNNETEDFSKTKKCSLNEVVTSRSHRGMCLIYYSYFFSLRFLKFVVKKTVRIH